jgi:hypothetical protein
VSIDHDTRLALLVQQLREEQAYEDDEQAAYLAASPHEHPGPLAWLIAAAGVLLVAGGLCLWYAA